MEEYKKKLRVPAHIYWQSSDENPEVRIAEAVDACAREVANIILRDDEDMIGVIALHKRNARMIHQHVRELCSDTVFTVANLETLETASVKTKFLVPSNLRGTGKFDYLLVIIANVETDAKMLHNVVFPILNYEDTFLEVFDLSKK